MFERFTDRARRTLVLAQENARILGHDFIGTEHFVLGLINEGEGIAAQVLMSFDGVDTHSVQTKIVELIGTGGRPTSDAPFTPGAKKALELSLREALALGHNYIGTEHVLLGIVRQGDGAGIRVLESLGVDVSEIRPRVIQKLTGYPQEVPRRIQRKREKGWRSPEGAVNVTRPSKFGNPFVVGGIVRHKHGASDVTIRITQELAVQLFEAYVKEQGLEDVIRKELAGKDLLCWCKPTEPCHADVLLEIARTAPPSTEGITYRVTVM